MLFERVSVPSAFKDVGTFSTAITLNFYITTSFVIYPLKKEWLYDEDQTNKKNIEEQAHH